MTLREIMTREVVVVEPHTTLQEAAQQMQRLDVGLLPVCSSGRLVGVITDRDIAVRSTAEGHDPFGDRVRDAMTPKVLYCFEHQDPADAARIMQEHQVRRLPILDGQKRLVGIVALADLAVASGAQAPSTDALKGISTPAHPNG
jgi:CBS domain-containing protein